MTVELNTRAFAYYDAESAVWRVPADTYKVLIGESSAQIELTGEVRVANTLTEKP